MTQQPFFIKYEKFDKHGNVIYTEALDGDWIKYYYDTNNNRIYEEWAGGYWIKNTYDSKGVKSKSMNSSGTTIHYYIQNGVRKECYVYHEVFDPNYPNVYLVL